MGHQLLDPDTLIGDAGKLIVFYSRRPPTIQQIAALGTEIGRVGKARGRSTVMQVIWPRPGAKLNNARELTTAMNELITVHETELAAVALVMRDKGFVAATLRAIISAVMLAKPSPVSLKIFANTKEAGAWLESKLPGAFGAEQSQLIATVDTVLA